MRSDVHNGLICDAVDAATGPSHPILPTWALLLSCVAFYAQPGIIARLLHLRLLLILTGGFVPAMKVLDLLFKRKLVDN